MSIEPIQTVQAEAVPAAVIQLRIPRSEMGKAFPGAIHEILDALGAQGRAPAGPPFARHFRLDPEVFDFEVGFPVAPSPGDDLQPVGRMVAGELPAARVVRTVHHGPYEGLPAAWQAFSKQVRDAGIPVAEEFRERYVVGPESGPDASAWRTELSWVTEDQEES
ncbi:MAG: AraC family transcriptional regulator [Gemmatimonadales bacterium]|nr:MAG: AraC family transcriptional regulator [Gemmatimonadales bacterium]